MDKLPVGQLPDLASSNNDDEIMVITNSEYNQLKKEKISDFITDLTSTNENNALTKGTDGKMFVTDFGNASNITEGTLPTSVLPEIPLEKIPDIPKDKLPPIETSDLPVSGVTADTYVYPSSVTVNAQGQITAIEEGQTGFNNANQDLSNLTPEGEKHFLNKTQLTNCILEAPNGVPSYSGTTVTVQAGTNYLFPNGRNSNNSVKNVNFSLASAATGTITGSTVGAYCVFITSELELIFANQLNYFITNTQPTALGDSTTQGIWFNPQTNLIYQCTATASTPAWSTFEGAICATLAYNGSTITGFSPIYPISLLAADHSNDTKPYITEAYENGTSGYIIWSNGYCEQWGFVTDSTSEILYFTIIFLKAYKDTNYNILLTSNISSQTANVNCFISSKGTTSFNAGYDRCNGGYWKTCGYIA